MAKIGRVTQLLYGESGPTGDFGQFGSLAAASPVTTKNIGTIQALAAFLEGLASAVVTVGDQPQVPALEDLNGLFRVAFIQLAYLFQAGVPEWDSDTVYYENSYCQVDGAIYRSKTDSNTGNDPVTDSTNWASFLSNTPPGTLNGCVPSNDTLDATNGIHFTKGFALDDADLYPMAPAAMTKKVNQTWVAGNNQGGLDTGTIGASPCKVYLFALGKSTDPTAGDFLMSKSRTSPTMTLPNAGGFDAKRLVGHRYWDGSKFVQFRTLGNGVSRKTYFLNSPALTGGGIGSFGDVDASQFVDGNIASEIEINGNANGGSATGALYVRPKGSSDSTADCAIALDSNSGGSFALGFNTTIYINTSSVFEMQASSGTINKISLRRFTEEL